MNNIQIIFCIIILLLFLNKIRKKELFSSKDVNTTYGTTTDNGINKILKYIKKEIALY